MEPRADIGIIGGSGFYELLDDVTAIEVDTPWGAPSAPVAVGTVDDVRVAFIARHGQRHQVPPHRVNYRANVDALRQLGVRAAIGPFAAGSLRPEIRPGDLVVVDQLVDRTSGRPDTFHDSFDHGAVHISFADPYDQRLRAALLAEAARRDLTCHDGGTVVVVQGPRFSTRAESRWFRAQGWQVVGMTQHPEAALAMEAGIAYAAIALITDYDTGVEDDPSVEPVTQDAVFGFLAANVDRVRDLLLGALPSLVEAVR